MFETVTKPSFLEARKKKDVDWDKVTTDKSQEDRANCSNTHAIPPPESYDSQTPALKPTLGDTAVTKTRHKRHVGDEHEEDDESAGIRSNSFLHWPAVRYFTSKTIRTYMGHLRNKSARRLTNICVVITSEVGEAVLTRLRPR